MAVPVQEAVSAQQLLYGNLRKDESIKGVADFQLICSSLEQEDSIHLGPVLSQLRGAGRRGVHVERIFFATTRWAVVGQIVQTATTDSFNRPQYLAHVLLLETSDFNRLDNDPSRIWDGFAFVEDISTAVQLAKENPSQKGSVQPATVPILWSQLPDPVFWKAMGAARAQTLARSLLGLLRGDGPTLQLAGGEESISSTIRQLFRILPIPERAKCFFDTSFCSDSNEPRTEQCIYRIIGTNLGVKPNVRGFQSCVVSIDAGGTAQEYPLSAQSIEDRWVSAVFSRDDFWQKANEFSKILSACAWLSGDDTTAETVGISTDLLRANHAAWVDGACGHIQSLGALAAEDAPTAWGEAILRDYKTLADVRESLTLSPQDLSARLLALYIAKVSRPTDQEMQAIRSWAERAYKVLQDRSEDLRMLICIYNRWQGDWAGMRENSLRLSQLSRDSFESWFRQTLPVDLSDFPESVVNKINDAVLDAVSKLPQESQVAVKGFVDSLAKRPATQSPNQGPLAATMKRTMEMISEISRWFGGGR